MVGVPTLDPTAVGQFRITEREFQRFRVLVARQTGIALTDSKRQLVCSRLGKRLRHYGYATFGQYYEHLVGRDPEGEELLQMVNAITTNKTEFFREPHHFELLRSEVLPAMAIRAAAGAPRRLRIWSAGCSSGEEPYSIAMTLLAAKMGIWDARILASDIDTDVLSQGQQGVYPAERLANVPRDLRERCFSRGRGRHDGLWRVRSELRDLVVFRRINLREAAWPIRALFDCIFCRNVLIYFDRALQQEVVGRLVTHLRPGGYLFLGHSESLLGMSEGLSYLGNTVYRKAGGAGGPGAAGG